MVMSSMQMWRQPCSRIWRAAVNETALALRTAQSTALPTTARAFHVLRTQPSTNTLLQSITSTPVFSSVGQQQARMYYSEVNDSGDDDDQLTIAYLETLAEHSTRPKYGRVAMEILQEIQGAGGNGLNIDVSTAIIDGLASRRRWDDAIDALRYSREQSIRPRIHAYSSIIASCYKAEKYAQALKVFEVMRNDGYVPKTVTYSRVLSAALKSSQHELVLEIFDDMMRNKVELTIVIYNNILNSCARVGDVRSALGVLRAIRQRDLPMTQSTYHSLAICAGKSGHADLALDAYESLKKDGYSATLTMYNSIISACAKGRKWDDVVAIYEEMGDEMRSQVKGIYLAGALMGYAKSSNVEKKLHTLDLYHQCKVRGEELNTFAKNAILVALLETEQYDQVLKTANKMKKEDGFQWDTLTHKNVILAHIRSGAIDTAVQLLGKHSKQMDKSTDCYRELIEHYANERQDYREACRLTMQMMQSNPRLSRLDWHNALEHALKLKDMPIYWNFRKWMKVRASGIIDDVPQHLMIPDPRTLKQQQRQQQQKA